MIKAVIFDMDGLLIDSEPLWQKVNEKVYGGLGFDWNEQRVQGTMGRRTAEIIDDLYHEQPWQGASKVEVQEQIIANMVALIRAEGQAKAGAHHALQICKQAGLPVAIASSSVPPIIDAVVDVMELHEQFDHIQSAHFEEYGKPNPAVFLTTAKKLGVQPQNCLVFEDSPSGVLAAKAAKMHCIAVPEPEVKAHKYIQTADLILDSLEEFNASMLQAL